MRDRRYIEPEARVPAWLLRTPDMAALVKRSPLAVHCWLLLGSYASPANMAWCSQRRLAKLTGSYRRSVVEALGILKLHGWIEHAGKHETPLGGVDLYRLTLPPDLEEVRRGINDRLRGVSQDASLKFLRADDIYMGSTQLYQRMARVTRSVLSSEEWKRLRNRSGQAMHLYLLLCCYAANGERVSGRRLGEETHLVRDYAHDASLVRVRNAIRVLADPEDQWITVNHTLTVNGGSGASSFELVDRLVQPAQALDQEVLDEGEEDLNEAPPYDLVQRLPTHLRAAVDEGMPLPDQWRALRDAGLWPRRETLDQAALRMIRSFQAIMMQEDTSAYQPTPAEWNYARQLFRAFGPRLVWEVANAALGHLRRKRWEAGNFTALRSFVAMEAAKLGISANGPV